MIIIDSSPIPRDPSNGRIAGPRWRTIETAPKKADKFILLWCPEDRSRWLASWQGGQWFGVDEYGLRRSDGYSLGDPNCVTGWGISHWMPLPTPPRSDHAVDANKVMVTG